MTDPLPPGPRPAPFVPEEGRIDRRQLAALLRLLTAQMLRRGTDASSGMKGHPVLQTVYGMGFLGLLAASRAFQPTALDDFLVRLFASAFVIAALAMTAEADDVRIRRAEILLPKPIAGATHLASVAILLFLTTALVTGSFAAPPILAASFRLGLSPLLVVPQLAILILGAFGLVLVWVLVLRLGVAWVGAERIRMATQIAIVAVMLLMGWSSLAAATGGTGPPRLAAGVFEALPSSWFARFWTDGWSGTANLRRAGALGFVGLAAGIFALYARNASADSVFETAAPVRARVPLLARLLIGISRAPGLRLLLPPRAAAISACILTLGWREEASRLRGFTTLLLAVAIGAWGLWGAGGMLPIAVLASVLITVALEGVASTRQSASAPAAWVFAKAPLTGRDLLRAVQWAVLMRFVLLPLALFSLLAFRRHEAGFAALLVVGGWLTTRLVVATALALRPALPLDDSPAVTGVVGQIVAWMVGMMGASAYAVAALLVEMLGLIGLVTTAFGTVLLGGAILVAQTLAVRRLGRLEHAG